jgi:ABC-type glycerol-3-phosphate transport system permease component
MDYRKTTKHIILYTVLAIISLLTIFPLLWGFVSSIRTDEELFKYAMPFSSKTLIPQEPTFQAYHRLFTEFKFYRPIKNTFILTFFSIILGCTVNGVAAFAFATFKFRFKKVIFSIVLLSFMIPFESIALPLYNVIVRFHWVETYLGLIVPGIADGLVLFLFTQFFRDIPTSMIEAARVDGASWSTVFFRIIMPSSIPVFVTAGLMIFMGSWNSYLWPLLVGRTPNMQMVQIAIGSFTMEHSTLWSCIYAGSIISALIPLCLLLPFQKYYVQGVISSGIKG